MVRLTTLFLALLPSILYAQAGGGPVDNPCAYPAGSPPAYYTDNLGKWACMPAPGGTGSAPLVRLSSKGIATFWYCPDNAQAPTKWSLQMGAATWARLATGSLTPDTPMADPSLSVVWCPYVEEARAAAPVVKPPEPAWKVALPTAFSVNSTFTGLTGVAGTVPVGIACDCAKRLVLGSATYCTFTGAARPTVVAQCKQ